MFNVKRNKGVKMKWKLVNAYFGDSYWPKIKPWNNDLFAREGRLKVTLFNPYSGSVVVCPKYKYEKAYREDVEDEKKLKWYRKYLGEQRKKSREEPTSSYYGRWTSTNAKNIYKYLNEKLRAD